MNRQDMGHARLRRRPVLTSTTYRWPYPEVLDEYGKDVAIRCIGAIVGTENGCSARRHPPIVTTSDIVPTFRPFLEML